MKQKLKNIILFIKHYLLLFYNIYFNSITKAQHKNYKSIPIIIISFNQYFYLKQLVDFLIKNEYTNIVIVDNDSSYPPLLKYFEEIANKVTLHRLKTNEGHMVFWKNKEIFDRYSKGYYVVTDSDIVPISNCPHDFLRYFKSVLDAKPYVSKVGFSLKIDDLPENNFNKQKIIDWEVKFWDLKDKNDNYIAPIDTTFALYKPNSYHVADNKFYKAIRTKYPYMVDLVKKSSLMIIPRVKNLNSGSLFLGLTFDIPMIIPKIGNLSEIVELFKLPFLDLDTMKFDFRDLVSNSKQIYNSEEYQKNKQLFHPKKIAQEYDAFFDLLLSKQ